MNWLKSNWRYFAIFGGLIVPILAVGIYGAVTAGEESFVHVMFREFVIHVPWGFCLTALFVILMMTYQNQRDTVIGWKWRYAIPLAAVMACAAIQEFGFSMTELFAGRWGQVIGGDWNRELNAAGEPLEEWEKLKSIADLFGWLFGTLAAIWYHYKAALWLWYARDNALAWKLGQIEMGK